MVMQDQLCTLNKSPVEGYPGTSNLLFIGRKLGEGYSVTGAQRGVVLWPPHKVRNTCLLSGKHEKEKNLQSKLYLGVFS